VSGLSALSRGFPRQEIIHAIDLVVWDAGEHIGQLCLWVDIVQFGGFDQGVGDGSGLAAGQ